jgi:hypothetical protein
MCERGPSSCQRSSVLSEASARAARAAKALGFLDSSDVSIVHAFCPYAKAVLGRTDASQEAITKHVVHTAVEVAGEFFCLPIRLKHGATICN